MIGVTSFAGRKLVGFVLATLVTLGALALCGALSGLDNTALIAVLSTITGLYSAFCAGNYGEHAAKASVARANIQSEDITEEIPDG